MKKNEDIPMSLENLPNYIKSLKENKSTGGSCLVDVGTIEIKKSTWTKKFILATSICLILGISGFMAYNLTPQQFTITVNLDKDADPQIFATENEIVSVKQNEDNTYELKVSTRKSKRAFLESLKKNKNVKKAE